MEKPATGTCENLSDLSRHHFSPFPLSTLCCFLLCHTAFTYLSLTSSWDSIRPLNNTSRIQQSHEIETMPLQPTSLKVVLIKSHFIYQA